VGEKRNAYKILSENLKGRHHAEDFGVDGRVVLRAERNILERCGLDKSGSE
jgi:hypothetical protein